MARRGRREMHTGFWLVKPEIVWKTFRIWNNNIKIDLEETEGRS